MPYTINAIIVLPFIFIILVFQKKYAVLIQLWFNIMTFSFHYKPKCYFFTKYFKASGLNAVP